MIKQKGGNQISENTRKIETLEKTYKKYKKK